MQTPRDVELEGLDDLDLDRVPLAVIGRIALDRVLIFDDDPPCRVRWQADTRRRYVDEAWRRQQASSTERRRE
jgi:hypothetical protein